MKQTTRLGIVSRNFSIGFNFHKTDQLLHWYGRLSANAAQVTPEDREEGARCSDATGSYGDRGCRVDGAGDSGVQLERRRTVTRSVCEI